MEHSEPLTYHLDLDAVREDTNYREGRELREHRPMRHANVGSTERIASALGGGALVALGVSRMSLAGLTVAAVGGALLYRAATAHCPVYEQLGMNTADDQDDIRRSLHGGEQVKRSITIARPIEEVYMFWRSLENLPLFMKHLKSVKETGERHSHWTAEVGGMEVEWDAEIINESPNELIAWRSLPGSDVDSAGSVRFRPGHFGEQSTDIIVKLAYRLPAGSVGTAVARVLGEAPEQQIAGDLQEFKRLMEGY